MARNGNFRGPDQTTRSRIYMQTIWLAVRSPGLNRAIERRKVQLDSFSNVSIAIFLKVPIGPVTHVQKGRYKRV